MAWVMGERLDMAWTVRARGPGNGYDRTGRDSHAVRSGVATGRLWVPLPGNHCEGVRPGRNGVPKLQYSFAKSVNASLSTPDCLDFTNRLSENTGVAGRGSPPLSSR